ncbi:MAG: hypothetical protein RR614_07925 [Eubacterium sp.]
MKTLKNLFPKSELDLFCVSTRILCELHGCIHLYHTNIIKEIGAPMDDVVDNLIDHILLEFRPHE